MNLGANCIIDEPTPGWVPKTVDTIVTLLRNGVSKHVGTKDLAEGNRDLAEKEAMLYALFDTRCQKCPIRIGDQRIKKNRLYILVNRVYSSYSTALLRVLMEVEATPAENLRFSDEGEKEKDGSSWLRLRAVVVHPIFEKGLTKFADRVAPIEINPPIESIDAGISVHSRVRVGSRGTAPLTLDIPVTLVPSEPNQELQKARETEEGGQVDLTAIVVATSLKILMEDSWRWLKSKVGDSEELISLRIGDAQLTPQGVSATTDVAKQIAPLIVPTVRDELMGSNRQLDSLAGKKRRLLEEVERASTGVERARTRAEIDEIERDMADAREKLYAILEMHANLRLQTKS